MGANSFITIGSGKSAREAFRNAVEEARQWYGNGYTGTIAEKSYFIMFSCPKDKNPREYVEEDLINDRKVHDKWGPAGCLKLSENEWIFFGYASS